MEAALRELEQEGHEAHRLIGLALVHHALGEPGQSDLALATLIGDHAADFASGIACVLAFRGEADAAFERLYRVARNRDSALPMSERSVGPRSAPAAGYPRPLPYVSRDPTHCGAMTQVGS